MTHHIRRPAALAAGLVIAATLIGGPMPVSADETLLAHPARWDFNGDSVPDLAVGAPGHREYGENFLGGDITLGNVGRVLVHDGRRLAAGDSSPAVVLRAPDRYTEEISPGPPRRFRQYVPAKHSGSRSGEALASGDFNGDGAADLAVGAPGFDNKRGAVYVYYGVLDPTGTVRFRSTRQTLTFDTAGALFGSALAAGDFNDDGIDDLAIGAPGTSGQKVAVFNGTTNISGLSILGARFFSSTLEEDRFGAALASGDLNGDGVEDLVVGSPGRNSGDGAVRVIYGNTNGITSSNAQTFLPSQSGIGVSAANVPLFGAALAVGDLDGDGRSDLVIGAPGQTTEGFAAYPITEQSKLYDGKVVIMRGHGSDGSLNAAATTILSSQFAARGGRFGAALAVGAFNGDIADDVAIGVPDRTVNGAEYAGMVEVFYGATGSFGIRFTGELRQGSATISGGVPTGVAERNDRFGSALTARNLLADRTDYLAIGVPGENYTGVAKLLGPSKGQTIGIPAAATELSLSSPPDGEIKNVQLLILDDIERTSAAIGSSVE